MYVKIGGVWKTRYLPDPYTKIGGVWKQGVSHDVKIGGVWKLRLY